MDTSASAYTTGFVTSEDGTTIGYRQLGHGPGVILVHGGMQASQNFMKLAVALSDQFTVYAPDRRGRGLSGPFGGNYGLERECEDLQALLSETGTHYVFGLSSGAIIALHAALTLSAIRKVALYEPPFPLADSSPTRWVARFDEEIAKGDLASAIVTVMKGTGDSLLLDRLPRFILVPLMRLAIHVEAKHAKGDHVSLKALIPTMHYDPYLVNAVVGTLESLRALHIDVLLLGGSRSQGYLRAALDALSTVLPNAKRVEFSGVGHLAADNDGKPELVADELSRFFGAQTAPT